MRLTEAHLALLPARTEDPGPLPFEGEPRPESYFAETTAALIEALPVGYRTVFNLYAIEGYAHIEIAQMLGITESTSKSQLHRARALLQKMVAEWQNDYKKKVDYEKASC